MRILLTNDDGIYAPGLELLACAAADLGEVWIVAPGQQCSGMSQRLTIFGEMPVQAVDYPVPVQAAWQVGGTPADCIKLALECLLDFRPDFVFSGVNDGWNTGFDLAYSGTVGACLEALLNGLPAIAFSAGSKKELSVAQAWLLPLARELTETPPEAGAFWNVNFPLLPLADCRGVLRGQQTARMSMYRSVFTSRSGENGLMYYDPRGVQIQPGIAPEGTDIAAVLAGYISVGQVRNALLCAE